MNPPCAFCKKTVYPTEKFNCLDKIWHKGCFKCSTCSLKLTMNTYKGYDKMPYCKAHYPHLTHTQVAKTVEQQRLSNITKQQSQVEYHKSFNQSKGSKLSVADDPETMRQKKVSANQSDVVYQNRAAKKAEEELRRPASENQPEPVRLGGYQAQQPPPPSPPYNEPPPASYGGGGGYEPEPEPVAPPPGPPPADDPSELRFKALYDYAAADDDEVSFAEDDLFKGKIIDDGWLEGVVLSTGQYGLAPRNYFEEM